MNRSCVSSVVRGPSPQEDGFLGDLGSTADNEQRTTNYFVSHGKNGGVGSFAALADLTLRRGDRVLVRSPRGQEVGAILRPAASHGPGALTLKHSGIILRRLTPADDAALAEARRVEDRLFEGGRKLARAWNLPLEILDAEVLFDRRATLHFLGEEDPRLGDFAEALAESLQLDVLLENLALPAEPLAAGGCGKPDCGRAEGGGCSTCGTGGCSTCASHATDLRPYFAHLRERMEEREKISSRTALPVSAD